MKVDWGWLVIGFALGVIAYHVLLCWRNYRDWYR